MSFFRLVFAKFKVCMFPKNDDRNTLAPDI